MDHYETACAALEGGEFDWLLIDTRGCVALCETAGFGEVPDVVLDIGAERFEMYSSCINGLLQKLPEICRFTEETTGFQGDTETPAYARRGFYIYDWRHWNGPYNRIATPDVPLDSEALRSLVGEFAGTVPFCSQAFETMATFQLADLLPCHRLRLD